MAERTSSRAGSRRTTPQPAPQTARVGTQSPPKRTTRMTRSQSRDVSENEERRARLKARKSEKQVSPDATNGAVGRTGPNRRKGRVANNAQLQQDLSVVAEDPSVVYPDLEIAEDGGAGENVENAGAAQQPTQQNYKSPGGLSAFSGTTARTSIPTQDLTELSPEDMLDTLPDLSDASGKFLSFVVPAELSEASVGTTMAQFQNKDTREHKKLKRLGDTFERQRKEYGGDSYINVGDTLRRLLGRKLSPINQYTASWRPDALIQKANLAILVLQVLSIAERDQKDHFLEDIAGSFPQPFAQRLGLPESLTPECTALAKATFLLALEVRTQEAIMLLARHVRKINFDPDTALLQLFYDGNDLKGWAVPGLRIKDLSKEDKDTIVGRVEQLRGAFRFDGSTPSDGSSYGIDSLRVAFSWTTFAHQMVAWAGQRQTEIEIQTMTYGGAQAICQALSEVLQSGKAGQSLENDEAGYESDGPELRLEYDVPAESRASPEQHDTSAKPAKANELVLARFSAISNTSKASASIIKQRIAGRKATTAPEQVVLPQNHEANSFVQVASTAGPPVRALIPQHVPNDQFVPSPSPSRAPNIQESSVDQQVNRLPEESGEEEEDTSIHRNAQASLAYRTQREAESNKENVAEIPDLQQAKTAKRRNIYDRDPLAERVSPIDTQELDHNNEGFEISSDEGFERQRGSPNAARQRRLKPATKRPASETARPQRRSPKKPRVEENSDVHELGDRASVARHDQETEPPLSQAYDEYVRVNQSAKRKMAAVPKLPQSRSAWTGLETTTLIDLISEHGTSWQHLKHEDLLQGHVLRARDQVALKDKARNMKMDHLKAGKDLPRNFERIPLSQLQIKRLRDGGIEYDPETGTRVDAEVSD